jgi:two-component system, chemotaxis family, chemotaxis protein CheY
MMYALVIDDSRAMREILGRMLKEIGYEVSEAAHGREALERLRGMERADLALVDWNMPEMDGYEFLRAVRSDPTYDKLRVMMVTTECGMDKVRTALDAGADDYIMKPFTVDVIREKLALLGIPAR